MSAEKNSHRRHHRHRHHRTRVGRHPGAEHAAAALVAVAVLRLHRLGHRLLSSPIRRSRCISSYTKGLLGYSSRGHLEADMAALKAQRGASSARSKAPRWPISRRTRKLLRSPVRSARPPSAPIALPATARARQGAATIPNLNDDHWIWGGTLDADPADHPARHPQRAVRIRTRGRCRPSARTASFPRPRSRTSPPMSARWPACKPEGAGDVAKGKALFADNCAACHGEQGKGNPEVGAPNLTANIWLYGGDQKTITRRSPMAAAA